MARLNNNLAYDFDEREELEVAQEPRIKHYTNPKRKASARTMIELLTLVAFMSAILFSIVFNQIEVSKLTREQSELSTQLTQLKNECTNLEAQLASKTGITAVEDYAENTLGLTKLDKAQVEFVEIDIPTVSEVIETEEEGFFASVKGWVEGVKEYLGIE
ncbi:MAG: cell division protein FtsL [Oscillospiraceae bacterium]|nr:cell division protein FtsL [Oscillospiraceae bacterium]